jgi:hypothetical protein
LRRYCAVEDDRALRPALADKNRPRDGANCPQRCDGVGRSACDVELFFRADDQVEQSEVALQLPRDLSAFDVAAFARAMARKAPEIRAVIDVERRARTMSAGDPQCLQHRRLCPQVAEMRPRRHDRTRLRDESLLDVVFAQRHVCAIGSVEDQRELLLVANAE